jgi:hypothetical protein
MPAEAQTFEDAQGALLSAFILKGALGIFVFYGHFRGAPWAPWARNPANAKAPPRCP